MNKGELIDKIAKDAELTKVEAAKALDSMMDGVSKTLKKGDKVIIIKEIAMFSAKAFFYLIKTFVLWYNGIRIYVDVITGEKLSLFTLLS